MQSKLNSRTMPKGQRAQAPNQSKNKKKTDGKSQSVPLSRSKASSYHEPKIKSGNRTVRVTHREFIKEIKGQTLFTPEIISIQPGLPTSFPWLSGRATGWEQYCIRSMKFELLSRRGGSDSGSILMAPDYNVYDGPPATETALSAYSGCQETSIWRDLNLTLDVKAFHAGSDRKYITDSTVPSGDFKTYSGCNLIVATTGVGTLPDTATHKLWVSYTVDFFVPEVESKSVPKGFLEIINDVIQTVGTSGVPEKIAQAQAIFNGLGAVYNPATKGWSLPKGWYQYFINSSSRPNYDGNAWSELTARLNTTGLAASKAGSAQNSATNPAEEMENTLLGCFYNDVAGKEFSIEGILDNAGGFGDLGSWTPGAVRTMINKISS